MKIGKSYKAEPFFTSLASVNGSPKGGASTRTAMYGKCVFIHPKGRFVTLEFPFKFGVVRECFRVEELL